MSPDQYYKPKQSPNFTARAKAFSKAFPHLHKLLCLNTDDFRGLSMFIGDDADIVCGLRGYSDDGTPTILWASGTDPFLALKNCDDRLSQGAWKPDKKILVQSNMVATPKKN